MVLMDERENISPHCLLKSQFKMSDNSLMGHVEPSVMDFESLQHDAPMGILSCKTKGF